jgi:hypothetical protein
LLSVIFIDFEALELEELIIPNLFGIAVVQHVFLEVVFLETNFLVDFCCATQTSNDKNKFNPRKMIKKLFFIFIIYRTKLI